MKYTHQKLLELQNELKQVVKEVESGNMTQAEAADKIIHLREEMDKVIEHLKTKAK
jgi:hypothetical protein